MNIKGQFESQKVQLNRKKPGSVFSSIVQAKKTLNQQDNLNLITREVFCSKG